MMKRTFILLICAALCVALGGCFVDFDLSMGNHPLDQENTRWVSEDPDIYFEVSEKYSDITGSTTYGKITIDGVTTEIMALFAYGTTVNFVDIAAYTVDENGKGSVNLDMWLFIGRCRFSKNKLVVNVFNNEKGFLDDSVKKITFIKEQMEDDGTLPSASA